MCYCHTTRKICSYILETVCKVQATKKYKSLIIQQTIDHRKSESTQTTLALCLWQVIEHCGTSPHAFSNLALKWICLLGQTFLLQNSSSLVKHRIRLWYTKPDLGHWTPHYPKVAGISLSLCMNLQIKFANPSRLSEQKYWCQIANRISQTVKLKSQVKYLQKTTQKVSISRKIAYKSISHSFFSHVSTDQYSFNRYLNSFRNDKTTTLRKKITVSNVYHSMSS